MKRHLLAACLAALIVTPAWAEGTYKIGVSAGLSGYAATTDTAWRDGVLLAAEALNAKGGIAGRKIEVIVEDNRSEPQEAVTAYRKMLQSDKVDIFASGCVSAGNFAAAAFVVRAQVPMVLCSILPNPPDQVRWAFSTLPPPKFEVETRLKYLQDQGLKSVGILHDPTPYANLQATIAEKEAAQYGLKVAGNEQYRQEDADLAVQLGRLNGAGAQAILKIGLGGTTLTAAKNIRALGLSIPMLNSLDDVNLFRPVADVLGDKFLFVASPSQVYEALPAGKLKSALTEFLTPWRAKYGDRDPNWASRGWDAVMLTAAAVQAAGGTEGPKVRDALETVHAFQGTTGVYSFGPDSHYGLAENPLLLAQIVGPAVRIVP